MIDAMGNSVPVNYVKKEDKLRDRNVRRILARFQKERAALEKLVADCIADLDEIVKTRGAIAEKGNISVRSFDSLIEVNVRQQYTISLNESVCRAREMMISYVGKIIEQLGNKAYPVQKIVEAAFKTDAKGFLSRSKITELLALDIRDPEWVAAADILREAMTREKGKRYLSCKVRKSTQHDFTPILLDIAACWPEPPSPESTAETTAE